MFYNDAWLVSSWEMIVWWLCAQASAHGQTAVELQVGICLFISSYASSWKGHASSHQDPSNHRKTPGCKKRVAFRSQIQSGNYWFYMILHHLQKCTMDMDGVSAAGNAVMLVNSHHLTFSHVFLGGGNCRRSHLEYLGNFIATSTECRWLTGSTWYAYLHHIHWTYNVHHNLYNMI